MCGAKKKCFVEFPRVIGFLSGQSAEINAEYREIVLKLETEGCLSMPFGEKLKDGNLFAIRVINAGNVRVFYVYGKANTIYGIHGYTKKTQSIPQKELKQARRIVKALKQAGLI